MSSGADRLGSITTYPISRRRRLRSALLQRVLVELWLDGRSLAQPQQHPQGRVAAIAFDAPAGQTRDVAADETLLVERLIELRARRVVAARAEAVAQSEGQRQHADRPGIGRDDAIDLGNLGRVQRARRGQQLDDQQRADGSHQEPRMARAAAQVLQRPSPAASTRPA